MNRNLADERQVFAMVKRLRKANRHAKEIAHGGWGEKAKAEYETKYPEVKKK